MNTPTPTLGELHGVKHTPLPWYGDENTIEAKNGRLICAFKTCMTNAESAANRDLIVHRVNDYERIERHNVELREALEMASELVRTARQYFPKSMHDSAKFKLEQTSAKIADALTNATLKATP